MSAELMFRAPVLNNGHPVPKAESVQFETCPYCPFTDSPTAVRIHKQRLEERLENDRHPVGRVVKCKLCPAVQTTAQFHVTHMRNKHDQKGHMCRTDLRWFKSAGELKRHQAEDHGKTATIEEAPLSGTVVPAPAEPQDLTTEQAAMIGQMIAEYPALKKENERLRRMIDQFQEILKGNE